MPVRTILTWPNKKLNIKSDSVSVYDDELSALIQDLIDTMRCSGGAGLAAPQVGVHKKIVVVDCSAFGSPSPDPVEGDEDILTLVNPVLELSNKTNTWTEACLSVPGFEGRVTRSKEVVVSYSRIDGTPRQVKVGWPLAGAIQHECDHLEGRLYVTRMSMYDRRAIIKRLRKKHQEQQALTFNEKSKRKPGGIKKKKPRKKIPKRFGVTKKRRK